MVTVTTLKKDLLKKIRFKRRYDAILVLRCIFVSFTEELIRHGKIKIEGFGTFSIVETKPKRQKNPHTKEIYVSQAKYKVKFKPSHVLVDKVNEGTDGQQNKIRRVEDQDLE